MEHDGVFSYNLCNYDSGYSQDSPTIRVQVYNSVYDVDYHT